MSVVFPANQKSVSRSSRRSGGRRRTLLSLSVCSASLLALLPSAALAQEDDQTDGGDQILVTGSRIVRDGNDAPTPVSVISAAEIEAEVPANVADFVNTLPSISGSQTAVSNSGSLSNGQSGISALNLRSLGQNRTLVLIDGQRSVGSTSTGLVDINTIPQALIERVEVVTGGASSVYGSDAVAGVVNFILDKDFTGIEANYEYGVTTYGDLPNHKVNLTAGTEFADGRGHVMVSGEYFTQNGKHSIDRAWNETGFFQIDNPDRSPGQPARLVTSGIGSSNFTPGGLITSGPFRGTYFGPTNPATGYAGVNQLTFGTVSGQWMIGGDTDITSANHAGSNSLANDEERIGIFGRASYEFSPAFEVFAQGSYNRFDGYSIYQQTPSTGVTIRLDNAFLPPAFLAQVNAFNASNDPAVSGVADVTGSISIGTSNAGITGSGADTTRKVQRYVVGGNGMFELGGIDLDWDAYFQYGATDTNEALTDTWLNSRMAAQQDAVFDGSGNIVCRVNIDASTTNDLPGCVPLNRIGSDGPSQEALDFLFQVLPSREQYIRQKVWAFNLSTNEAFSTWEGPVSIAIGGEYREDSVNGYIDPINLETFLYGNFRVTKGDVNVKEAYVETLVPLGLGLEFNGALRLTDYSLSGSVTTWKAGLTWEPIYDVRLRATLSRDIRAPNLNELFDAGTARTNSVNIPLAGGGVRAEQFIQNLTGSTNLTPEIAETYGIGVVVTPSFLPGFSFAADYFHIKIDDAIGSVSAQTTVNLCFEQNIQSFCDNIRYVAGSTTDIEFIDLAPFNFAQQVASGMDLEASYSVPVGPGDLSLRALGTYYIKNVSDNGIDAPNDTAGVNAGGGIPTFTYRATASYAFDSGFSVGLVARGFSSGVYDNDYIECVSGCPVSDPVARTINTNSIKGTLYTDANMSYEFSVGPAMAEAFFSVRNLFDVAPVLVGNGPDGNNTPAYPQTNRGLYDTIGRTFRVGLRVKY
jgi:iron complex outermembrane receptor protein